MTTSSRYKGKSPDSSGSYPGEDELSQIAVPGNLHCMEDEVLQESLTAPRYPDVVLADAPSPDGEDLLQTALLSGDVPQRLPQELRESVQQSSPRSNPDGELPRNGSHRVAGRNYRESGGGGGGSGRRVRQETQSSQSNRKRSFNNPDFELLVVPEQGILDYLISTVAMWLERLRDSMIRVLTPSAPDAKPSSSAKPADTPTAVSSKKERRAAGRHQHKKR